MGIRHVSDKAGGSMAGKAVSIERSDNIAIVRLDRGGKANAMSFAIMDMGDSILDSYAVVDNFRWSCEGCVPNEVNSCGVEPQ
jgi:hypothetical protein